MPMIHVTIIPLYLLDLVLGSASDANYSYAVIGQPYGTSSKVIGSCYHPSISIGGGSSTPFRCQTEDA